MCINEKHGKQGQGLETKCKKEKSEIETRIEARADAVYCATDSRVSFRKI